MAGRHFLCLRPAAYKRVLRMAGAMGVDCLFPVGDGDASKVLAKTPGFDWMNPWEGRSPFKRDQEGLAEYLLPAPVLHDWCRLSRLPLPPVHDVSWLQDHENADRSVCLKLLEGGLDSVCA